MILYVIDRNIRVDNADNQISYNSDYVAEFHFDDEWNGKIKTARFVQNGEHFDVVLVNDRCKIPPLKTGFIRVGVFSDSMTSTYADVYFKASIKDGSGNPAEPPEDVYAQLTALIESGILTGDDGLTPYVGENGNWWLGSEDTGILARGTDGEDGYTPVKGTDYFTDAEVKQIQNEVSSGAIGDFKSVVDTETNKFNTNAAEKLTEYNDNATEKLNAYNSNADSKFDAYNTNAETKFSGYNSNAESKLAVYNQNDSEKTEAYNINAQTKLADYNTNADNRVAKFDAHTEQIQADVSELKSDLVDIENEAYIVQTDKSVIQSTIIGYGLSSDGYELKRPNAIVSGFIQVLRGSSISITGEYYISISIYETESISSFVKGIGYVKNNAIRFDDNCFVKIECGYQDSSKTADIGLWDNVVFSIRTGNTIAELKKSFVTSVDISKHIIKNGYVSNDGSIVYDLDSYVIKELPVKRNSRIRITNANVSGIRSICAFNVTDNPRVVVLATNKGLSTYTAEYEIKDYDYISYCVLNANNTSVEYTRGFYGLSDDMTDAIKHSDNVGNYIADRPLVVDGNNFVFGRINALGNFEQLSSSYCASDYIEVEEDSTINIGYLFSNENRLCHFYDDEKVHIGDVVAQEINKEYYSTTIKVPLGARYIRYTIKSGRKSSVLGLTLENLKEITQN